MTKLLTPKHSRRFFQLFSITFTLQYWLTQFEIVANKAKERISKQVFQENKARQIFRKTNISYPLIRSRRCAYQGVRNVCFSENLACFFLKNPFWDLPFYLITDEIILLFSCKWCSLPSRIKCIFSKNYY